MGISQGIDSVRTGVCTSSSRPASPFDGQVIYETDTDKTLVYNGTSWVFLSTSTANPVGLVYITQANPSGVTSVSVNNCFSSTYDNYKIVTNISTVAGDSTILFRLRASGTDSTVSYASERLGGQGSAPFSGANASGTDDMYLGFVDIQSQSMFFNTLEVHCPALSRNTPMMSLNGGDPNSGNTIQVIWGGHKVASAYDGFTIISGTAFTGTIRVYGYQNS